MLFFSDNSGASLLAKGGRVRYMLNGFEEDINYILDSTNAVEVARDGKLGDEEVVIYFETKDENFAKGGVAEGYSKFRVVFYNYSGETEEKEFDYYSDAYDYYNDAVDNEVGGGTTTIILQGYSDKYDEFEDIFYFDPTEMSEEDEDFAKGGKLDDNFTQGFVKGDIIVNDSNSRYVVVTNKGKVYIVGDNGQRGQQMRGKVKPTKAGDLSLKDVRKYQQELEKQFFAKGGQIIEYSKVYEILENKIEDAVADLYSTYENSEQAEGEEVEYKSRDGFIPFTNGGYSSRWFEYSYALEDSVICLPNNSLDDMIEEFREKNR